MRIALACDWFLPRLGGIEVHLRDLARRLRAAGHDVHVVTPTPGPREVDGIPVHRIAAPLFPGYGFVYTPGAFRAIDAVLRSERFDIVHAHASIVSPTAYGAALAALHRRTPTLVTFHSVLRNHAWWLRLAVRALALPRRGAWFSGVSGVVAREAQGLLGIAGVAVLPNAVDTEAWRVRRDAAASNEILLVSAMRLVPKKRPLALIRMLAELRAAVPDARFRVKIAGAGSERSAVERLVARRGLSDIVELTGRLGRDELRALYARAHAFVLPTTLESFGIAVLEARAAGLPVAIRREAGVAELLEDGVDGVLAPSDAALVAGLARLITDATFRERIAAHNAAVAPPASWPAVLAQHVSLYEELAAIRAAPVPAAAAP